MLIDRIWSTEQACYGKQVKFWKEAICEAIFELDVSVSSDLDLCASLKQQVLGPISVSEIELNAAQTIRRTASAIARSEHEQFELVAMLTGKCEIEHRGRESTLRPGDVILIDSRQPLRLSTEAGSRNLSFHFPLPWLERWMPNPETMIARPIRADTPWGQAIGAMASMGRGQGRAIAPDLLKLYAEQLTGAIVLALAEGGEPSLKGVQRIYAHAREALREHAHDCELDASAMASILGISVRYLHKIFAAVGTTYSAELFGIRLERAFELLADRRFVDVPVNEIAWRTGFSDPSHFYRRFRARYNCAPGHLRAMESPQHTPYFGAHRSTEQCTPD